MLTLKQYDLLVTLAEDLHFGRASERLGISQPQLTQQLKQMEEFVGTVLFERNRRRVELSPAGRILLPEARAVLRQAARAQAVAMRAGHGVIGELALGYIGAASYNGILTHLLRSYRDRAPDVRLQLRLMDLDRQIPEVSAGNLDAGIVRLPYPNMPDNVEVHTLCAEELCVALPATHRLAGETGGIRLEQLRDDPFVATHLPPNTGFSASMHRACASAGITPDIIHCSPQFASIVSLVAAGLGVALVPGSLRNVRIPGAVYLPLPEVRETADISLVCQRDSGNPVLDTLLSCLPPPPTSKEFT